MKQAKYDVFISYSRKDYVDELDNVIEGNCVSKIKNALSKAGITYWFDEDGIYSGDKFTEKIIENIKASHVFLFLSTRNSCSSHFTSKEIACADELGKYIIPVRIDHTPYNEKILFRIADLSYVDYWKNPQKGIEAVIKSIKTYLSELKDLEEQKKADEKYRLEILDQKHQQEEKNRLEKIGRFESEISTLELQKIEYEKIVLKKEQDLRLSQIDLKACEEKIQKLQIKLQELVSANKKTKETTKSIITEDFNQSKLEPIERLFKIGDVAFRMIRVKGYRYPFYIGESQVTQELWEIVMHNNPSHFLGKNHPVECVNWNDCQVFINKLNELLSNIKFRLPKVVEWEFASKGGDRSCGYVYAGSNNIDDVAWYDKNAYSCGSNNPSYGTHDVMTKRPNELGIYDMSGNVWEWCEDIYESNNSRRVVVGGSWYDNASSCRVDSRSIINPDKGFNLIGFRLAMVVDNDEG